MFTRKGLVGAAFATTCIIAFIASGQAQVSTLAPHALTASPAIETPLRLSTNNELTSSALRAAVLEEFLAGEVSDPAWNFKSSRTGLYSVRVTGPLNSSDGSAAPEGVLSARIMQGEKSEPLDTKGQIQLEAGKTYRILAEEARQGLLAPLTLQIDGPLTVLANDELTGRTLIAAAAITKEESESVPPPAQEPPAETKPVAEVEAILDELYWSFTPEHSGLYAIDLAEKGLRSDLTLYEGNSGAVSGSAPLEKHGLDDRGRLRLLAGTTYTIRAEAGVAKDKGPLSMKLRGPGSPGPNATMTDAKVIDADKLPYLDRTDTTFNPNGRDNSASAARGGGGSPDAYYRFTPTETGRYRIVVRFGAYLESSAVNAALAVYTGEPGNLTEILAKDVDPFESEATVIELEAGTSYMILAEGFGRTDFGRMQFSLSGPEPSPQN